MAPALTGLRSRAVVVLVALAVAGTVAGLWFGRSYDAPPPSQDELISSIYQHPANQVERLFTARDGQIFATLATDPLASDPGAIWGGPVEQAYRYQRPGYGWLGWLASGGQRGAVPYALIGLTVASVGVLVGVLATALQRSGAPPFLALVVLLTPGVMADLVFIGPEVLATALGVGAYLRLRRRSEVPWSVVALFAAAGLFRESLLLFPAVLALMALAERRPGPAFRLAAAAVPYVAWVVSLRARIGAWPAGSAVEGRLTLVPFAGLVEELPGWVSITAGQVAILGGIVLLGLATTRDRQMRALMVAHVAMAAFMGPTIWMRAEGVGRTMLPLGVLAIWGWAAARAEREATDRATETRPAHRVALPA